MSEGAAEPESESNPFLEDEGPAASAEEGAPSDDGEDDEGSDRD